MLLIGNGSSFIDIYIRIVPIPLAKIIVPPAFAFVIAVANCELVVTSCENQKNELEQK
jgi:hypothetical protein